MNDQLDREKQDSPTKTSFGRLLLSAIAAAFGVQSDKNRRLDFQHSSIMPFIVAGVLFTTFLVLSLIFLVSLVVD